jgi:hypothetical protein
MKRFIPSLRSRLFRGVPRVEAPACAKAVLRLRYCYRASEHPCVRLFASPGRSCSPLTQALIAPPLPLPDRVERFVECAPWRETRHQSTQDNLACSGDAVRGSRWQAVHQKSNHADPYFDPPSLVAVEPSLGSGDPPLWAGGRRCSHDKASNDHRVYCCRSACCCNHCGYHEAVIVLRRSGCPVRQHDDDQRTHGCCRQAPHGGV